MNKKEIRETLANWKYPLLILAVGVVLLLIPSRTSEKSVDMGTQEALALVLSETQGVGKAHVLISDKGVVVVCTGAANPSVRLDILHAVSSYTGFGSDKVTILKLDGKGRSQK
jgi:hypothetical protein